MKDVSLIGPNKRLKTKMGPRGFEPVGFGGSYILEFNPKKKALGHRIKKYNI